MGRRALATPKVWAKKETAEGQASQTPKAVPEKVSNERPPPLPNEGYRPGSLAAWLRSHGKTSLAERWGEEGDLVSLSCLLAQVDVHLSASREAAGAGDELVPPPLPSAQLSADVPVSISGAASATLPPGLAGSRSEGVSEVQLDTLGSHMTCDAYDGIERSPGGTLHGGYLSIAKSETVEVLHGPSVGETHNRFTHYYYAKDRQRTGWVPASCFKLPPAAAKEAEPPAEQPDPQLRPSADFLLDVATKSRMRDVDCPSDGSIQEAILITPEQLLAFTEVAVEKLLAPARHEHVDALLGDRANAFSLALLGARRGLTPSQIEAGQRQLFSERSLAEGRGREAAEEREALVGRGLKSAGRAMLQQLQEAQGHVDFKDGNTLAKRVDTYVEDLAMKEMWTKKEDRSELPEETWTKKASPEETWTKRASPHFSVDLSGTYLTDRGVVAAVTAEVAALCHGEKNIVGAHLHTLNLQSNKLGDKGIEELFAWLSSKRISVHVLKFFKNPGIRDAGARAIGNFIEKADGAPPAELHLSHCGVGVLGAADLLLGISHKWRRMKAKSHRPVYLRLDQNPVSVEALQAALKAGDLSVWEGRDPRNKHQNTCEIYDGNTVVAMCPKLDKEGASCPWVPEAAERPPTLPVPNKPPAVRPPRAAADAATAASAWPAAAQIAEKAQSTTAWVRVAGEGDGGDYFWNSDTEATLWSAPGGANVDWVAQRAEDGRYYYWNKDTLEVSWDPPSVDVDGGTDSGGGKKRGGRGRGSAKGKGKYDGDGSAGGKAKGRGYWQGW